MALETHLKGKIPFKVACFMSKAVKEACLTQDNLMKRELKLCSRCYVCEESENNNHFSFALWSHYSAEFVLKHERHQMGHAKVC